MENQDHKSKEQLLKEIEELKTKVSKFEKSEYENKKKISLIIGSEAHYRQLFNLLPYGGEIINKDGVIINCSQSTAKMLGYEINDIIGKKITDFVDEETKQIFKKNFPKLLDGKSLRLEISMKHKNGTLLTILRAAEPIYDTDNKVTAMLALNVDITERKQMEQLLKESEENFQQLVSNTTTAVWKADIGEDGTFENQYTSYVMDELLGLPVGTSTNGWDKHLSYIKPEYMERVNVAFKEAIESPGKIIDIDFEVLKDNGQKAWFNSKGRCFEKNGNLHIVGSTMDITERKLAEEKLALSEKFLNSVIEQSPVSMWISDSKGTLTKRNQANRELSGATDKDVVGKYNLFKDNLIEEQGFLPLVENVFEKGEIARFTIDYDVSKVEHIEVKEAAHRIVDIIISPIKDMHGKVINAIVQHKDITDLKKAEEKAIEEKNKAQQYLNIANIMLISIDSSGLVQLINPKGCEVLGYSEEEIIGRNWFDNFLPVRLRENVKVVAKKIFNGEMESAKYYENEILTKSGEERLIAWHNAVLKDDKGKIIGTLSSGENITERKHAEKELLKHREKLKELVNERTNELEEKNKELDKTLKVFVGRELTIRNLQKEIIALGGKL